MIQQDHKALNDEYTKLKQDTQKRNSLNSKLDEKFKQASNEFKKLREDNENLSEKLKHDSIVIKQLEVALKQKEQECLTMIQEFNVFKLKAEHQISKNNEALTKAQEINKKKVESLEKEIKDQKSVNTEKIEKMEQEISSLKIDYEKENMLKIEKETILQEKSLEITQLQIKIKELNEKIKDRTEEKVLQENIDKLNTQIEKLTRDKQLQELNTMEKIEILEKEKDQVVAEKQYEIDSLCIQHQIYIDDYQKKIDSYEEKISALNSELSEKNNILDETGKLIKNGESLTYETFMNLTKTNDEDPEQKQKESQNKEKNLISTLQKQLSLKENEARSYVYQIQELEGKIRMMESSLEYTKRELHRQIAKSNEEKPVIKKENINSDKDKEVFLLEIAKSESERLRSEIARLKKENQTQQLVYENDLSHSRQLLQQERNENKMLKQKLQKSNENDFSSSDLNIKSVVNDAVQNENNNENNGTFFLRHQRSNRYLKERNTSQSSLKGDNDDDIKIPKKNQRNIYVEKRNIHVKNESPDTCNQQ